MPPTIRPAIPLIKKENTIYCVCPPKRSNNAEPIAAPKPPYKPPKRIDVVKRAAEPK